MVYFEGLGLGLGFMVSSLWLGFRVLVVGFRIRGLGFLCLGFTFWGLG